MSETKDQLDLFEIEVNEEKKRTTVFGGIYTELNEEERDPLGPYAIAFGGDSFCFLFDGIDHVENIVEHGRVHIMMLVEGYGLKINKVTKEFKIVNSSILKSHPDYCIFKGNYAPGFEESLEPFLKLIHK